MVRYDDYWGVLQLRLPCRCSHLDDGRGGRIETHLNWDSGSDYLVSQFHCRAVDTTCESNVGQRQ